MKVMIDLSLSLWLFCLCMLQEFRDDGDGDHRQGRGSQRAEHGRRPSTGFHFVAPCCARPRSRPHGVPARPGRARLRSRGSSYFRSLKEAGQVCAPRCSWGFQVCNSSIVSSHSFMPQRSCLPRGPTCPGRACLRGAQVSKNAVSLWLFVIVTKLHNCIFNFSSPSLPEM